ncbi:MAG: aminopeptidase [Betaproteobacteria bacterium]|nr:aminopeptidase [Betaproteobacteria bacterium]MDH3438723.1 aminopeptidase [Betaproteobacteria bacterium]
MLLIRPLAIAGLLVLMGGCNSVGYYWQSVSGQLDMWGRERPVPEVIGDPDTDATLRRKLARVEKIRDFASDELKLPDNASYRRYADLERPFAVWNVFAAPEFSVSPIQWCFLVVGCVAYRGYFDRAAAERFSAGVAAQGHDVYVGGVPAYSTLGYFADPLLNTFMQFPDVEIARLLFHELAHQVAYAPDDTVFNESFATAVEAEGMKRWLTRTGNQAARADFERRQYARDEFKRIVERSRQRLDALYRSGVAPDAMRIRKAAILEQMDQEYRVFRDSSGFAGYDHWFAQRPNNAQIASVVIYTQLVPAFQSLLEREGGDLGRFYARVKMLASLPKDQRADALRTALPQTQAEALR